jgi:hypothetical protein
MPKKESVIQREILGWLHRNGIIHWRVSLGPVVHSGGRQWAKNPMKGHPDIEGIFPNTKGQLFGIEVKSADGKLSTEQEQVHKVLRDCGCIIMVCRSLSDVCLEFHKNGFSVPTKTDFSEAA